MSVQSMRRQNGVRAQARMRSGSSQRVRHSLCFGLVLLAIMGFWHECFCSFLKPQYCNHDIHRADATQRLGLKSTGILETHSHISAPPPPCSPKTTPWPCCLSVSCPGGVIHEETLLVACSAIPAKHMRICVFVCV